MSSSRTNLKTYFQTGKKPTQAQFEAVIDSFVHLDEDKALSTATVDVTNDTKFVTPKAAKSIVDAYGVKKVNNIAPDAAGNVTVTNIAGTAAGLSANIAQSQVTGLTTALDAKVASSNLRTVNGNSLIGTTDLVIGGSAGSTVLSSFLTDVQTVTGSGQSTLTGNVFVIPPGKSAVITGILSFTSSLTTSGASYGIKVQQQTGGTGNVVGAWSIEVGVTSATSATSVRDGGSFVILPNNTSSGEVTGTTSTTASSGNISATLSAILKNTSTTLSTTVTITLRPYVTTANIIAQPGSGTIVVIS